MTLDARFLAANYHFPPLQGDGQRLAIVEVGDAVFTQAAADYCNLLGVPTPNIKVVPETQATPTTRWTDGSVGPSVAAQVAASLVPSAEITLFLCDGTEMGILDAASNAVHSGANVVCLNLSIPEDELSEFLRDAIDDVLKAAVLTGVTVCCPASLGSESSQQAAYPASNEWVLAVGSTGLLVDAQEVVRGEYASNNYGPFSAAGPFPQWQRNAVKTRPAGSGRALPDVVACDACDVLIDGKLERIQSPSIATLIWGALLTLACEELGEPLGFINQLLWTSLGLANVLRQVAITYDREKQQLGMVPPWAPWTGWGSPDGERVVRALAAAVLKNRDKKTGQRYVEEGARDWHEWQTSHSRRALNDALNAFHRARLLGPKTSQERFAILGMEREALAARLQIARERGDLDRMASVLAEAVDVKDEPSAHGDYGYQLMLRFFATGALSDLDTAVIEFKKALAATQLGDDIVYTRVLNVAWASEERFKVRMARGERSRSLRIDGQERWAGARDLVLPISHLEGTLAPDRDMPPPAPEMVPQLKRNLANLLMLYAEFERNRPDAERSADVRRAIQLLGEALAESAPESQEAVTAGNSLFAAYLEATALRFVPADVYHDVLQNSRLIQVLEASPGAAVDTVIAARARLNLASLFRLRSAANHSEDDERGAISVYRQLVDTTTPVAPADSLAAAVAWANWALGRAGWTEVAEANRAAQFHITTLLRGQRNLLDRYVWTRSAGTLAATGAYALAKLGRLDEAAEALEQGRAIMLSERADFFRDSSPAVSPAGRRLLYLVCTAVGGLGLVSGGGAASSAHWLPQLSSAELHGRMLRYLKAYDGFRERPRDNQDPSVGWEFVTAWWDQVGEMTTWLGETLGPLLAAVGASDVPLAIVPVGQLALLPLFSVAAAALTDGAQLSVVPSARVPGTAAVAGEPERVLVAQDLELVGAAWDAAAARGAFSNVVTLSDTATLAELTHTWPSGGVVHFACHACANTGSPLKSTVRLPGGDEVEVGALWMAHVPRARLVVLSACETGVPDPATTDEAIGISAVLLASAADSVVATQWEVDSASTALLMLYFYWRWRRQRSAPSSALSSAQRWMRDSSDQTKLDFVRTEAVTAGLLDATTAAAMSCELAKQFGDSPSIYAHPYFWAGFLYSG